MIHFQHISKSFNGKPALVDISLQLIDSKIHVVLGSSGSGKSTLLKILLGLIAPDHGTVELNGEPVSSSNQRAVALKVGYVIQEGGLFPHLTCAENAGLVPRLCRWSVDRTEDRIRDLCEVVGLERSMLDRFPQELSGGQRQRVGLIRALMNDPPLLVLDEPLGALDPIIRSDLQSQLKTIFTEMKKTVLMVTHDIGEAAFLGDTVSLFHDGRLVQHGAFADLLHRPSEEYVTKFVNAQRPPDILAR